MVRDYRGSTDENYQKIVEQDKADIDHCDALLVNHLKPSVGTSMEILYAWEQGKKVFIVSEDTQISPWLIYHSTKTFRALSEAVDFIKEQD